MKFFFLVGIVFALMACEKTFDLKPLSFSDLPGWEDDHAIAALPAMIRSCKAVMENTPGLFDEIVGASKTKWRPFCQRILKEKPKTSDELRVLITEELRPFEASLKKSEEILFTGYYEPQLRGSRKRHGSYQVPLYKLPDDESVNIKLPRSEIVEGALANKGLELLWVNSRVDAFFLEIQGSGRVVLDTGETIRIGYNGKNGFSYYPIGLALIERGILKPKEVSLQSIKAWLIANPKEAQKVMNLNKSFVFFREIKGDGPIGSQGVALTPRRSLAVDNQFIELGTIVWADIDEGPGTPKIQRLMVAQDTGGAIKKLRADFFWGFGAAAERAAGQMKTHGKLYLLLPK